MAGKRELVTTKKIGDYTFEQYDINGNINLKIPKEIPARKAPGKSKYLEETYFDKILKYSESISSDSETVPKHSHNRPVNSRQQSSNYPREQEMRSHHCNHKAFSELSDGSASYLSSEIQPVRRTPPPRICTPKPVNSAISRNLPVRKVSPPKDKRPIQRKQRELSLHEKERRPQQCPRLARSGPTEKNTKASPRVRQRSRDEMSLSSSPSTTSSVSYAEKKEIRPKCNHSRARSGSAKKNNLHDLANGASRARERPHRNVSSSTSTTSSSIPVEKEVRLKHTCGLPNSDDDSVEDTRRPSGRRLRINQPNKAIEAQEQYIPKLFVPGFSKPLAENKRPQRKLDYSSSDDEDQKPMRRERQESFSEENSEEEVHRKKQCSNCKHNRQSKQQDDESRSKSTRQNNRREESDEEATRKLPREQRQQDNDESYKKECQNHSKAVRNHRQKDRQKIFRKTKPKEHIYYGEFEEDFSTPMKARGKPVNTLESQFKKSHKQGNQRRQYSSSEESCSEGCSYSDYEESFESLPRRRRPNARNA